SFFLMDCVVTPLKTLMGFSVHLNVQLKFYNLPHKNGAIHHVLKRTCFLALSQKIQFRYYS
ncbi:hypothetical protein EFT48_10040, partial [Limosilactobacillus fermentum]|nr:hypothetical protein [Limosilactobacillus fermentum]